MTAPYPSDDASKIQKLIDLGIEIAGGAATSVALSVLTGPMGLVAGAISAPLVAQGVKRAATEISHRMLGNREKVRVGAVLSIALATIESNLDAGKRPRQDWLRQWPGEPTPESSEIAEAVLMAAQREPEEKKLILLGKILGNIGFRQDLDGSYANFLVRSAHELTYRQFCLLALFVPDVRNAHRLSADELSIGDGTGPVVGVLLEIHDLASRSMVQQRNSDDTGTDIILTPFNIVPVRVATVTGPGGWLLDLAGSAASVPALDVEAVAALLRGAPKD